MAASKRVWGETGSDPDQNSREKRLRPSLSFRSVIVEVMRVRCFHQSLCGALEPLLRKVVNEEVDRAIRRRIVALSRSPSLRIKGPIEQQQQQEQEPSNLKLVFAKQLSLPIFTGSKIHDSDKNPLRITLVREQNGHTFQESLPYPVKIELVAIDGDFSVDRDCWSTKEFEANIIKERACRRPLLAGELVYTMRDGFVAVGEIEFTDNSSWVRGRKFRVGARVVDEASHGVRVLEAVSEPFNVRDHRGECEYHFMHFNLLASYRILLLLCLASTCLLFTPWRLLLMASFISVFMISKVAQTPPKTPNFASKRHTQECV